MKSYIYEGKTEEEIINKVIEDFNVEKDDIILNLTEEKGGFLKSKKIKANIILKNDIIAFLKDYVKNIISLMGINNNIEIKKREDNINILISSNQNKILIGKEGKTIEALQFFLNQVIYNSVGMYFRISVDVGEYKLKKQKRMEFTVKRIAQTVIHTKVSAKLDPMNSYERRIIHTILADFRGIDTTSEGEEPNRYIVIKPKE
jgi:spoIIIJ-associated protein